MAASTPLYVLLGLGWFLAGAYRLLWRWSDRDLNLVLDAVDEAREKPTYYSCTAVSAAPSKGGE